MVCPAQEIGAVSVIHYLNTGRPGDALAPRDWALGFLPETLAREPPHLRASFSGGLEAEVPMIPVGGTSGTTPTRAQAQRVVHTSGHSLPIGPSRACLSPRTAVR